MSSAPGEGIVLVTPLASPQCRSRGWDMGAGGSVRGLLVERAVGCADMLVCFCFADGFMDVSRVLKEGGNTESGGMKGCPATPDRKKACSSHRAWHFRFVVLLLAVRLKDPYCWAPCERRVIGVCH